MNDVSGVSPDALPSLMVLEDNATRSCFLLFATISFPDCICVGGAVMTVPIAVDWPSYTVSTFPLGVVSVTCFITSVGVLPVAESP